MQKTNDLTEVIKRLGVIVALLLRGLPESGKSPPLRDQIQLLSELGVRPKDIAEILGRTPGYVSKELTTLRKSKKAER